MAGSPRFHSAASITTAILLALGSACSEDASRTPTAPGVDARHQPNPTAGASAVTVPTNECSAPGTGWIFCDDFETDRLSRYFEYDNAGGRFLRTSGTGVSGSVGMRATYLQGPSSAGSLHLAFGSVPSTIFRPVDAGTAKYREVYWRFYARRESGWQGTSAGNLTRATIFANANRSQAMSAHVWSSETPGYLLIDPASGTTTGGTLVTVGENDYAHMRWLGPVKSAAAEEDQAHVGQWSCYEFHVKLNSAGLSDGVFELTVNGQPSARKTGLNWVGSYNTYGINAVYLEQYTYDAVAAGNARTLDNFVVSTAPIGCGTISAPPPAPVASVTVTPATSSGTVGQTVQLTATTKDASGNTLSGRTVTWASTNTAVATVSATGLVTLTGAGTTSISATSEGVSGQASVTAKAAVAAVTVTPATASGTVGGPVQLTATTRDASGAILTGRTITWASNSPSIATVNASGLVSMVGAGSATISATSEGKTGSAAVTVTSTTSTGPNECATPGAAWIFCDDFETDRMSRYFEYNSSGGKFARAAATGLGGSVGMRATYTTGQASAGSLALAFGRTPSTYFRAADAGTANYREVYWRFYVRREAGWVGNGAMKLTRATIFAKSDWSQAMIAHGWTYDSDDRYLMIDPASGTDASGNLITVGYNDFNHLRWLGGVRSAAPEEDQAHVGQWACYEYHVKLNDAGQSNGVFEFRVNGQISAQKTGMNWVGAYNTYGINAVFLENFMNTGAPAANQRTLDNFVVSTQPIGCHAGGGTP